MTSTQIMSAVETDHTALPAHATANTTMPQPAPTPTHNAPAAPAPATRLLGLVGAVGLFTIALKLEGGNPIVLMQVVALLIILALSLFGLIASHGPTMVGRLLAVACGSHARDDAEASHLRSMCRRGRRLCYASGLLCLLTGTMHVLSVLDHPQLVGPGLAVALVGPVLAVLIAELGFGAAENWMRAKLA